MKRLLKIAAKIVGIVVVAGLLLTGFTYFQGIQYTLALLTGSLRNPYFDDSQYPASQNCHGASPCSSGVIRVLTYNVLCRVCVKEDYDPWDTRVEHLRGLVEHYAPDLIGSQELGGWQDIQEYLPEGDVYGIVTFCFGPWTYADSALFYRKSRYEVLDSGQFWLSPNPKLPFGFGWLKLSAPRYLTWVCLRDRDTGFTFLFLNSHLDNNPLNKENSAPLIFKTFGPHAAQMPMIFTGDFNTNPTTDRYEVLRKGDGEDVVFHNSADIAARRVQRLGSTGDGTEFTAFEHTIDHIFLAGPAKKEVLNWVVNNNVYGPEQRSPSDHPAIFAEVRFESLP
ncbi:MAG TPA: endonuclease/exonuclease/phosphatase family protein [Candidatus Hydrogenedentes bacterium]|nr:endonuclease/exonuclease/phosphatase family protein [Candidatus Hydrogenedentota bacterium]